jgi:hypothetical protein
VTGHTAHTGQTRSLDTERESQVTHGDLDHGVCVHLQYLNYIFNSLVHLTFKNLDLLHYLTESLVIHTSINLAGTDTLALVISGYNMGDIGMFKFEN